MAKTITPASRRVEVIEELLTSAKGDAQMASTGDPRVTLAIVGALEALTRTILHILASAEEAERADAAQRFEDARATTGPR